MSPPPRRRKAARAPAARDVEVTVDRLGAQGDGIATWNGKPLYIPLALPGERVRVRTGARRGDGLAAELLDVLAPSADRVPAPCPHFGRCGGCATQHLASAAQALWKAGQVRDALARRGLDPAVVGETRSAPPGDRRRATFAVADGRGGRCLGFRARASHAVVGLVACPVLDPALGALLGRDGYLPPGDLPPGARAVQATRTDTGLDLVLTLDGPPDLAARESLAALAEAWDLARLSWRSEDMPAPEPLAERRPAEVLFDGAAVAVPPAAFLQPGPAGEALLAGLVGEALAGAGRVADLYCGLGTFALRLARHALVHAVDGVAESVAALDRAAGRAGLGGRVTTQARDLEARPLTEKELAGFDAVLFDPPRAGARAQCEMLAGAPVARAVAVSCNPATFARDARILVDGGWTLGAVTPVDQFPWSGHVELVAVFNRR